MLRRMQREWDHYLTFFGMREATDGWTPSTRYRVVIAALFALLAYTFISNAWERGWLLGLAALAFALWVIVDVKRGGIDSLKERAQRRPYADAAYSIPIGLFASLLLFPHWSVPLCMLVTAGYAALVFALTRHRVRGRAPAGP